MTRPPLAPAATRPDGAAGPAASTGRWLGPGLALVLLADVPGLFTRGDVLRGVALLLVAALAAWSAGGRRGTASSKAALHPAAWGSVLLLLPLLVALPAALAASRPSLVSAAAWARHVGPWLALSALAWALLGPLRRREQAERLWAWTLLAGALAGAWTYVGWLATGVGAGPFGRPGVAGPVLGALLGPALVVPLEGRPWRRPAVLVLLGAGLAVTGSRTGWAAGALGLCVALARGGTLHVPRPARRLAVGALVVGALAAGLLLTGAFVRGGDTLEVRRGVWRASAALVAERPLTGHGQGAFRAEILRVRDLEEARLSRGREPFMAHNDVLHATVEGGIAAGLALLVLLVGACALAWRRARGDALVAGAAALLVALAAASLAEQVLPDPAHLLLAALALATTLARGPVGPRPAPVAGRLLAVGLGGALLAGFALRARDVVADVHLAAFRGRVADGLTLDELHTATRERLEKGALVWRPDHPEALYRLGVAHAEQGRFETARATWRLALDAEPALTEARLDTAEAYAMEGRREDALAVLADARRHDPTRYDLVLRQGHVALGPEPVPGDGAQPDGIGFDPLEPLRHYNEAHRLAPDRFETEVAFARVARRLGDLESAARHLRDAEAMAGAVGEVLFESFHLAEVEGARDERLLSAILVLALAADVGLAPAVRREALACERAAREREAGAREITDFDAPAWRGAARAWSAWTVRALALLQAGLVDADALVREARALSDADDHRAALARRRALLAWVSSEVPADPKQRKAFFERRGNLLVEAAQSASRVDGALARGFYAEGHLLKGLEFLEDGALPEARRVLAKAAEDAPTDARPLVALARAHARAGDLDAAETAVLEALRRVPEVGAHLAAEPDLAQVLPRPKVREALAR